MAMEPRRRGTDRFEALRELTRLVDRGGDTDTFAAGLNAFLCHTFDALAASVVLVDPRTDDLIFHTASGAPGAVLNRAKLRRGEGLAGWVCANHQAVNILDARTDTRFCDRVDQVTGFYTRALICAPLWRPGQVEGAIEVLNRADGQSFSDEDLQFLEIIAEQVELLVSNAYLIAGLQRRNDELTTLIDIDRAVNAVDDLNELLGTILDAAANVAGAAGSSVVLVDPETGELTFFNAVGPAKDQLVGVSIEAGKGIVGHCIESGETIYVPDAYSDQRFLSTVDAQTGFRTTSLLAVPLRTSAGVIGALEVVNLLKLTEGDRLPRLMEAFASQAAVALERAQSTRRLARRVDRANEQLRQTNVSLNHEQARLTAMIGQMADGVMMIDADGHLLLVNEAAREIFDLGDQPLLGQPALDVQNVNLAAVLAVGDTGGVGRDLTIEQPRHRVLRVQATTVESEGRRIGRVVVCADITELKELAQIRTELVSFVSHELRTPLTSIKGFISALLSDAKLKDADHRSFIRIIDHECDRLRRMVADLLCMTRIDSGRTLDVRWQLLDLGDVVRHVLEAQKVYCTDHLLVADVPPEPLVVEADEDKLEQVLTNLINNAVKYSPAGTTITVRVDTPGDDVRVQVVDFGYGIAPEDIPLLFQQYGRLADAEHRRIRGTGLGLYLTKHLVEAHDGKIEVHSRLGEGSTFAVSWPRRRAWAEG